MFGKNFLTDHKLVFLGAGSASGGTLVESAEIAIDGYDGVAFFTTLETYNAGNSVYLRQSPFSGTGFEDVEGSVLNTEVDDDQVCIDIFRPQANYMKVAVDRSGAATATGDFWAVLFSGRKKPAKQMAALKTLQLLSPEEGAP